MDVLMKSCKLFEGPKKEERNQSELDFNVMKRRVKRLEFEQMVFDEKTEDPVRK